MSKKYNFQYIVIGSGPAGSTAALKLAKSGKHVALVEGRTFGGSDLNTRDVPYDVALDFAHDYAMLHRRPEFRNQDFSFSPASVIAHQQGVVTALTTSFQDKFKHSSAVCLHGYANFLDPHTIAVGDKKYTAQFFIIATGAHTKTTEISGTESVKHYTPDTILALRRRPEAVMVVGGGSTGCEIASYFASLGIKTLIAETSSRLLPREDKEVGNLIADYFTNHLGAVVLTSSKVTAIGRDEVSEYVIFRNARTEKMVRVDCIVLATGSEPNLDLGLENAGVKYKNTGITVDKFFTTSAKHIYAIGDCIGNESSTERANYEGSILAHNFTAKSKSLLSYNGIIRTIHTHPAIATVGLNEDDLTRRDRKYKKAIVKLSDIPASHIYGCQHGFVKLITDRNLRILGATIVAPHAELIAEEISIALRHNLTALELASTPHPINNFSYAIKLAAETLINKKLKNKH